MPAGLLEKRSEARRTRFRTQAVVYRARMKPPVKRASDRCSQRAAGSTRVWGVLTAIFALLLPGSLLVPVPQNPYQSVESQALPEAPFTPETTVENIPVIEAPAMPPQVEPVPPPVAIAKGEIAAVQELSQSAEPEPQTEPAPLPEPEEKQIGAEVEDEPKPEPHHYVVNVAESVSTGGSENRVLGAVRDSMD